MKKRNLIGLAAASSFMALCGSAMAADGTITITGAVTDTTCNVAVNGGSANATVVLPTVSASTLAAAGNTAGTTPFSIALTGCTGITLNTARTWFETGSNVDTVTGRLNSTGSATNVQVELLNSAQNPIVAGGTPGSTTQNDVPVDISSGSGTLNYYARYYAKGPSAAGSVATQVDYTIVYD